MSQPKVFISHAREDKPFVRRLTERLRLRGVDAWLDEWEVLPGDPLITKIFREGLNDAEAIIVVISPVSITKPWVREELDTALVRRIDGGAKIIPIILGDVAVPIELSSTVWVRVPDPDDYDRQLDDVVSAIFGVRSKPPLGTPPAHAAAEEPLLRGLAKVDTIVLKLFGERAVEQGRTLGVDTRQCWERAEAAGISRSDFLDSIEILERQRYLERGPNLAPVPKDFSVTVAGFDLYAKAYVPQYSQMLAAIAFEVVNNMTFLNSALAQKLAIDLIFVNHFLDVLVLKRLVEVRNALGGYKAITRITPELKRILASIGGA